MEERVAPGLTRDTDKPDKNKSDDIHSGSFLGAWNQSDRGVPQYLQELG